jgi:uncharacterized protein (DUF1778 family)
MLKTKKATKSRSKPMLRARLGEATVETGSRHKDGSPKNAIAARRKVAPPKEAVSRLEARIPTSLYQAMERAATLRGLTLTAYITATMGEDARRTIEEADILRLARADQIAFAEALINPPAPNAKLLAAKRRHDELIGK